MIRLGDSPEERFNNRFEEAFMQKEAKEPDTNEKEGVTGEPLDLDDRDPGEVGEKWDGDESDQHSPDVRSSADQTREGILREAFTNPPAPVGHFKKASRVSSTVQDRVMRLLGRR